MMATAFQTSSSQISTSNESSPHDLFVNKFIYNFAEGLIKSRKSTLDTAFDSGASTIVDDDGPRHPLHLYLRLGGPLEDWTKDLVVREIHGNSNT